MKKILVSIALLLMLVVLLVTGGFFSLKSSTVVTRVVLPIIEWQTGVPITAERAEVSPSSSVVLYGMTVGPKESPAFTLNQVTLRYDLWDALFGDSVEISEFSFKDTRVTLENTSDQSWLLPLTSPSSGKKVSATVSGVTRIELISPASLTTAQGNLTVSNVTPEDAFDLPHPIDSALVSFDIETTQLNESETTVKINSLKLKGQDKGGAQIDATLKGDAEISPNKIKNNLTLSLHSLKPGAYASGVHPLANSSVVLNTVTTLPENQNGKGTTTVLLQPLKLNLKDEAGTLIKATVKGNISSASTQLGVNTTTSIASLAAPGYGLGTAPLSDSTVLAKFDLSQGKESQKVALHNLDLDLSSEGTHLIDFHTEGTIHWPQTTPSTLALTSKHVDIDRILSFLSGGESSASEPTSNTEGAVTKAPPADTTEASPSAAAQDSSMPCAGISETPLNLTTTLSIAELVYAHYAFTNIASTVVANDGALKVETLDWNLGTVPAHFDGALQYDKPQCGYRYSMKVQPAPLQKIFAPLQLKNTGIDEGQLELFQTKGEGLGFSEKALRQSFSGSLKVKATEAALPSYLQDIPPFNLLFLPFQILLDGVELASDAVTPPGVGDLVRKVRGVLEDGGRIHLNSGRVNAVAQQGLVDISNTEINTSLLPTVTFDGTIGMDSALDIRVTLRILGIQVRIPVIGSLENPMPDLVQFVPQLLKGLGLSVISPITMLAGDDDEDDGEATTEKEAT